MSSLLPPFVSGYAALFRHPNDELNYCVYIIPGNPAVTDADLPHWHENLRHHDPYISNALGPQAKIERMKAGEALSECFDNPVGVKGIEDLYIWSTV